ncbi:thiolase family protein [Natrialbaceae archaeon AArc-T1-2]|uniref:thiolase family protein n=1 Tax=Natrialbaceae archaeon AArc-T1-2 TaxID=3053904 RepID=UPI00255B0D10|nr:thiolase family protein [Natrialbaceae archaeon AArc-T1-2]WIV68306.1 thiolase family protein [Natrialbaceae archaeon AArc-T1-2]
MSRTPVIVRAVRTPQGKEDGVFADVRSEDLSIPLVNEILAETGLSGADVDDLLWGCAQQRDEQDNNLARVVCLLSELGEDVPGTTINRWCASSMQALISAADAIRAGQRECLIAGGVESMTRQPMGESVASLHPRLATEYNVGELQMGMTAETVAEEYDISREQQDEYALQSHRRAAAATEEGRFDDEIVPIETSGASGTHRADGDAVDDDGTVTEDEGIRPDTDRETLAGLPTVFKSDGTVTPGNASQVADGAAALLVTSEAFADDHDLEVVAEVGANEVAGVDPTVMGIGPVPATRGLLERTGRTIEDYDLVELNEAFASQTVYCRDELGVDPDRFNVNGGAIAIGHPLGASGARLPVTLAHELERRGGGRGLATLCVGFGQGAAIELEVP